MFLRRKNLDHDQAADAIQGFFAHLLSREFLRKIERGNGLFRAFLLASLQNWLTDQYRADTAEKRGGGVPMVPLEAIKEMISDQSDLDVSPDEAFDRRWARTLYDDALEDLGERLRSRGREAYFVKLRGLFTGGAVEPYATIAADLATTKGALQQAVLELRREFGGVLRQQIRRTVAEEHQVDDELRYLIRLLRSN